MELALFDLDNTLLSGDSDYEWGQYLIEAGVVERDIYESENSRFYEDYKAGRLDIHEYLRFALAPLARHGRDELERWRESFLERKIRPMIRVKARRLVDEHLVRDALCAIITSTNSFVTAPIAREFGVAHLIATEPEIIDGRFTGRPLGTPCFREGKIVRLDQWLGEQHLSRSDFAATTFYSDSLNDLSLLEKVSRPVAVDPDESLLRTAQSRGWEIISLA